jgi:hypothetical protein
MQCDKMDEALHALKRAKDVIDMAGMVGMMSYGEVNGEVGAPHDEA